MTIVVLGSINADVVLRVPHLPVPGETLRASDVATYPGGKGANQAVAAARMGAEVRLVGRTGRDAAGSSVIAAIGEGGVDVSGVAVDTGAPTGTAFITVAEDGQNTIVTSGGANHRVGAEELERLDRALDGARMLLVQLEIPMAVVEAAVAMAAAKDVPVMLDPAPVTQLSDALLAYLDWLTPNEHETRELCGIEPLDADAALAAARELRARGPKSAIVTLGPRGCAYAGPSGEWLEPAVSVDAVDTVACGDAFNGALAAVLVSGRTVREALHVASAAGACAATRAGASASLPTADEVGRLLEC